MSESVSMKPLALGPTGRHAAAAIAAARDKRGLTYKALSDLLSDRGWPIPILGLRRIEAGARRVSVDDLVALSAALSVTPLQLLLPSEDPVDPPTGLNPDMTDSRELYAWARSEISQSPRSREAYWLQRSIELQDELSEAVRMEKAATYRDARLWAERNRERVQAQIDHAEARLQTLLQQEDG
ncbi:helix-turn-helix domain-containing protein [Microbacterium sp. Leaf436]|uniref:helix-turn-helix domain-containing protein n=1 Tax=Microbacterium sp. Leaf436 TaxID=1736377 RepID=UPI0006FF25DD|nr:helix-turn-helix domain-containing protein [Microbacterium sp. Leaf436]KQT75653.1 hypothetical protein ASG45_04005 [Microbacterium sp. Leaf436]